MSGAVVLLSGGLDSAVALAMHAECIRRHGEALTVNYGQRHAREIDAARAVASYYDIPHKVVNLDPQLFTGSALTGSGPVPAGHADSPDSTYVPARNTVLLALAAARAETIGASAVIIGCNADDAGAYPDCRTRYIESFRDVLLNGTVNHVWVDAPLLYSTKREVIATGRNMGVPLYLTWSCYVGGADPCGECGACISRGNA